MILLLILWLIFDFDCGSVYKRKKQLMMMMVLLVVQMEKREKKMSEIKNYYNNV